LNEIKGYFFTLPLIIIINAEEAAEFLKLTSFTVDYARRRILPARKVGKGWRFYKPDLVAWLRDYQALI
jgi:hypothetical protein